MYWASFNILPTAAPLIPLYYYRFTSSPGHPWTMRSGSTLLPSAAFLSGLAWMKCTSRPSRDVLKWGKELSRDSWERQSYESSQ